MRKTVVGNHRRNCRKQADGRGHERLGDTGCDRRERRLADVGQAAEGMHDAPHGAEQADVRADRTDRSEESEVRVDAVDLARKPDSNMRSMLPVP